jgi:PilZ domain-containing protein
MGDSPTLPDQFVRYDRRIGVRATAEELIEDLHTAVLSQGGHVFDGLRVVHADAANRRLLAEGEERLLGLRPGPATLYGVADRGLVRMPVLVLDIEKTLATLHVDVARAELEERRGHERLGVGLAVRGEPIGRALPFAARTLNISAGGAMIDVPLPEGAAYRTVLDLPGAELVVSALVVRRDETGSVLQFTELTESAERALAGQLIRAAEAQSED